MLFASREVRWEKVCPTELLIKYGGRGPNSRPKAQFQLIRTDRGQQITFFLCGIALKATFGLNLVKAVQVKSRLRVCVTFWAQKNYQNP